MRLACLLVCLLVCLLAKISPIGAANATNRASGIGVNGKGVNSKAAEPARAPVAAWGIQLRAARVRCAPRRRLLIFDFLELGIDDFVIGRSALRLRVGLTAGVRVAGSVAVGLRVHLFGQLAGQLA